MCAARSESETGSLLNHILRTDLASFVQKSFGTVSPGDTFSPNWHIEAMCHSLSKVVGGETRRLIISIPPRHLKSICASVALPAWVLGQDPTRRIICVSYAQDLSVKHANDCRTVMNSDWYRRAFSRTKLDSSKNTESEIMTTKRGLRLATSVGGTLTGRGGNFIIIDDPIKPADAMSEAARARVIEWFGSTLLSRLDDKENDAIVLVMQRLHEGDLAGELLKQGGWEHLRLPAIAELEECIEIAPNRFHTRQIGEILHPARESRSVLDEMKQAMGSAAFEAQYQQSPVPPGGNLINWRWFNFFDPTKTRVEEIVISWDTAMKATELSDYSVGTVWGSVDDYWFFLLDLIRLKLEYPDLRRKVIETYHQWSNPTILGNKPIILIEDAGSGTSLIQDLWAQQIRAKRIKPDGDKIVRMATQAAKIEGGQVFLSQNASWLEDLRNELLAFPNGRHDDQVDSMSQALKWMSNRRRIFAVAA
jgi:predicted phage terminase large subunit-like protein